MKALAVIIVLSVHFITQGQNKPITTFLPLIDLVTLSPTELSENQERFLLNQHYRSTIEKWMDQLAPQLKKKYLLDQLIQRELVDKKRVSEKLSKKIFLKSQIYFNEMKKLENQFVDSDHDQLQNAQSNESQVALQSYRVIKLSHIPKTVKGVYIPIIPMGELKELNHKITKITRTGKDLLKALTIYNKNAMDLLDLFSIPYQTQLKMIEQKYRQLSQIKYAPHCQKNCFNYDFTDDLLSKINSLSDGREYMFNSFFHPLIEKRKEKKLSQDELKELILYSTIDPLQLLLPHRVDLLKKGLANITQKENIKNHINRIYTKGHFLSILIREEEVLDQKFSLFYTTSHPEKEVTAKDFLLFRTWFFKNEDYKDHKKMVLHWLSVIKANDDIYQILLTRLEPILTAYFKNLEQGLWEEANNNLNNIEDQFNKMIRALQSIITYKYILLGINNKVFNFGI